MADGGVVYDYEDRIILDEVKRKMEEMISSAQQQGMNIESYYDLDPYGLLDEEERRQYEEKVSQFSKKENTDPIVFGPFYGTDDFMGSGPTANVPRTPSLLNLFVAAEEIAHASGVGKNYQSLASQPGMTNEEARYNEELRAKGIAYETVRGLLPKGRRTAQFTLDNYGYQFLEHIRQTTPKELQSQVIASMAKKYPELQDLIDSEERTARSQRAKQTFERKASGGFISMAEGGVPTPTRKSKKEQLADIEFRADMEIFIQNDPLARLGYKLYEDRNLRFNAFVANPPKYNKDGELIGGTRNTAGGAFYPAQGVRRDKSDDPRRTRPAPESVFAKGVKRQGVKSPIEDSIPHMFLVAGESITQDRFQSYITAAHELRHAALDYLSKKYDFDLEPLPVEEQMMDYADLMAREKAAELNPNVSKMFKVKEHHYRTENSSSIPEIRRKYDLYSGLAEKILKKEGYPAQTPAMEPEGFLTRTYKSLVN